MVKSLITFAAIIVALFGSQGICLPDTPVDLKGRTEIAPSSIPPADPGSGEQSRPKSVQQVSENPAPRPWWLGDLLTVLGIVVGAIIVIYQLGRQQQDKLKLQRENYREQFRLQIYQDFAKALSVAVDKNIDAGLYAFNILTHVRIYLDQISKGFPAVPLSDRAMELSKLHNESLHADVELIFLIERYQIVDRRLDIFRTALSAAHHDMMRSFMPLFSFLLGVLPADLPRPDGSTQVVNVINPSDDQVKELETLVNAYKAASDDVGCYLYDLNVEIQNTLLINLFPDKAPRRKPLDPKCKVISTDPIEMERLQKYFDDETDWGKAKKRTEREVLAGLQRH